MVAFISNLLTGTEYIRGQKVQDIGIEYTLNNARQVVDAH